MLVQNLKRFFEAKAGIERIDEQIKELKEDKKLPRNSRKPRARAKARAKHG